MKLRIIAGKYGGRQISGDVTSKTHPSGERPRGGMFNILTSRGLVDGKTVLDAFAGTGALGLEALSRGATHVTFIDRDSVAVKTIRNNIRLLNVSGQTTAIKSSVKNFIDNCTDCFDLIIADPPYDKLQLETVLDLSQLLSNDGVLALSLPSEAKLDIGQLQKHGLAEVLARNYGKASVVILQSIY